MKTELTLEIIRERWSPYAFSNTHIDDFRLKAMMEAAGKAPSCFNEQPWMFVFTTCDDEEIFSDYLGFMEESNKLWARHGYAIIIAFARTKFAHNGKPNRFAYYDTGMAVTNLTLQALAFDIYIHQMGGFDANKCAELLNLPADYEIITVNALGYQGDPELLHPNLKKMEFTERSRRMLDETVFTGAFGNKASFL